MIICWTIQVGDIIERLTTFLKTFENELTFNILSILGHLSQRLLGELIIDQ